MIKLGYYLHKTPSGKLIVKLSGKKPPKLGSKVVDSRGNLVGIVTDIIGPVNSPYAVIKPLTTDLSLNQLEEVYVKSVRG
ncbi:MAG: Gar1/Naf1 family protein [Desulfurococcaceae archaeon TW002]